MAGSAANTCADTIVHSANRRRFIARSPFDLEAGRIKRYSEVFDRGMALAQVGFAADRLQKIGLRYARELKAMPEIAPHLASDGSAPLSD